MDVYGAGLVPKEIIEYISQCHRYVDKVIISHKTKSSGNKDLQRLSRSYGMANERKIYLNFVCILKSSHHEYDTYYQRPMTTAWLQLLQTTIHECRHAWQYANGYVPDGRSTPYSRRREERDARAFAKREMVRLATRDKHLFWNPSGLFAKKYYNIKNSLFSTPKGCEYEGYTSKVYRIFLTWLEKYKDNADIPITKLNMSVCGIEEYTDDIKKAILEGKIGFWHKDSRGHRHCYLTMAEWIRLIETNKDQKVKV